MTHSTIAPVCRKPQWQEKGQEVAPEVLIASERVPLRKDEGGRMKVEDPPWRDESEKEQGCGYGAPGNRAHPMTRFSLRSFGCNRPSPRLD